MKKFKILLILTLILYVLAGCKNNNSNSLKGSVTINGSTSMEKLSNSLSEIFMEKHPDILVTSQFTGSSAGIEAVANNIVDIGNSSRELKKDELEKGVVENIVALDAIAVITHPNNPVSNLTKEQLKGIYNRTIKNWKELGGEDMGIVVIGRESGSGTRSTFENFIDLKDKAKYSQEIDSTGAVVGKVENTKGSIGYVSLDVLHNSKAKILKIDGFEPTEENVKNDNYMLYRPFIMATKGDISMQKPEIQEVFNFLKSEEGKSLITKIGLINVD